MAAKTTLKPISLLLWGLLIALLALPFLLTIAGDGQVHLAIAENFAQGRPFQYNPNGEIVVASTSPFWTIMLTTFYWLAGNYAPLLLKAASLIIWLGVALLLRQTAREAWGFADNLVLVVLLLWLAHTTIVANALGGLENVLSALQLLWLYALLSRYGQQLTPRRSVGLGLLLGWALLTRPDGGLFALLLLAVYGLSWLLPAADQRPTGGRYWPDPRFVAGQLRTLLPQAVIIAAVALLLLLPWYAYQFNVAGKLVTDSSVARLYNGRQGSLFLLSGWLAFHPKAIISLAVAFLPILLGTLITAFAPTETSRAAQTARFNHYAPLILLLAALIFFTFIVGAESFGRYFLPLYPFLFLTGIAGLRRLYDWLQLRRRPLAMSLILLAALFMAGTSLLDYGRRLGSGYFAVNHVLDVLYGPANRQYLSFNLWELVHAPAERTARTDELLLTLGASEAAGIRLAVTEVQIRYYLDERVEIISLDGRTSATILPFIEPQSGIPDFAAYFESERPDFAHVNQWCAVGGWLAAFFVSAIQENLVCAWERRIETMADGDSFIWDGRRVTLAAPEIVRLDWD